MKLSEAIERARLHGAGKIGTEDQYTKYTDNKFNNLYTRYTQDVNVWRKIHTEPLFKQVIDWGMSFGLLKWYCQNYNISFMKEAINLVKLYYDSYFTGKDPVSVQRVKLLRYIIAKEVTRL